MEDKEREYSDWFVRLENELMDRTGYDFQTLPNEVIAVLEVYEDKIEPARLVDTIIKYMKDYEPHRKIGHDIRENIDNIKRILRENSITINEGETKDFVIELLIEEGILPRNTKQPLQELHGHSRYDRMIFPKMASVSNSSRLTREVSGYVSNAFNETQKLAFIQWLNIINR